MPDLMTIHAYFAGGPLDGQKQVHESPMLLRFINHEDAEGRVHQYRLQTPFPDSGVHRCMFVYSHILPPDPPPAEAPPPA